MTTKYITLRLTDGHYLTIQRMSIFDRIDFKYHLQQCYSLLDQSPNTPLVKLYAEDDQLRYHINSCLEINHLPADRLSADQLVGLLFGSKEYPYGLLNQFNYSLGEASSNAKSVDSPDTKGSILGKLWRSIGDLDLAIKLCKELPVDVLEEALYQLKPEEERNKDKARELHKKLGEKYAIPIQ